jgi:predicted dehydrogenase
MTLKAGIAGCGGIAQSHIKGYQGNGIEITAVTDVNIDAAKNTAEKLGSKAKVFETAEELIKSGDVDLISICTPPVSHAEIAVCALENGVHVLCEKPLAHNEDDARKIEQATKKSNAKFMVAFRHRYLIVVQQIKKMVDNGDIGIPVMFVNEFGGPSFAMQDKWFCDKAIAGGGCMLDTSSHSVDLFRYFFGEVIEQHAVMHKHFENTDVEDSAILTLKSKSGVLGSLISGFVFACGRPKLDITGKKGRIIYEYGDEFRYYNRETEKWATIATERSNGFDVQISLFVDAIKNDTETPVTVNDGIRCLEIIQSNYK